MTRPELSELDYLREVERLARAVASAAAGERWYADDAEGEGPLQRSVNALGRALLHYHFPPPTGAWRRQSACRFLSPPWPSSAPRPCPSAPTRPTRMPVLDWEWRHAPKGGRCGRPGSAAARRSPWSSPPWTPPRACSPIGQGQRPAPGHAAARPDRPSPHWLDRLGIGLLSLRQEEARPQRSVVRVRSECPW